MKVNEVIETQREPDWDYKNRALRLRRENQVEIMQKQKLLNNIYVQNRLLWNRVETLLAKYPNDMQVIAHPSDADDDFKDHPATNVPYEDAVGTNFTRYRPKKPIFYDGEMKYNEPFDDAFEVWCIRKTKPQLAATVVQMFKRFETNDKRARQLRHEIARLRGEVS